MKTLAIGTLSLLGIGTASSVLVSCNPSVSVYDEDFSRSLDTAMHDGGPVVLADITDFEWTTVSIFSPYSNGDDVLAETGLTVLANYQGLYDEWGLWVFCADGEFVTAKEVSWVYTVDRNGTYPPSFEVWPIGQAPLDDPESKPVEPDCT